MFHKDSCPWIFSLLRGSSLCPVYHCIACLAISYQCSVSEQVRTNHVNPLEWAEIFTVELETKSLRLDDVFGGTEGGESGKNKSMFFGCTLTYIWIDFFKMYCNFWRNTVLGRKLKGFRTKKKNTSKTTSQKTKKQALCNIKQLFVKEQINNQVSWSDCIPRNMLTSQL